MRGIDVGAIIPDVGDDDPAQWTGKIDPHAPRRIIGRINPDGDRVGHRLARRRVGRFAGRHRHDLLAHDHEAVIENGHHHDQKDGQDKREFDEGLAFAPPPPRSQLLEVGESLHGSSEYMFVCSKLRYAGSFFTIAETCTGKMFKIPLNPLKYPTRGVIVLT